MIETGRRDVGLVPVETRQEVTLAVRRAMPKMSRAKSGELVEKCLECGFNGTSIAHVLDMRQVYDTRVADIVRWTQDGMSLEQIESALRVHQEINSVKISVALVHKCLDMIDFRGLGDPREVIEALMEACTFTKGMFPMHRLIHIVESKFGGDLLSAYHLAVGDPVAFRRSVLGIQGQRGDFGDEEEYEWTTDS